MDDFNGITHTYLLPIYIYIYIDAAYYVYLLCVHVYYVYLLVLLYSNYTAQ